MIVPSIIQQKYDDCFPFLREIERRVEETMIPFCRENGFIFDGRIKTLESAAEKIESGRFSSWDGLDDLYAFTVAVPLSVDEEYVRQYIKNTFEVASIKERGQTPKPPDVFRFDSTRISAKLRSLPGTSVDVEPSIFNIEFEVQVKSLFDYAWSKTTHALTYKSGIVDWKRYRLTAHLKAVVEQADFLLVGFEKAAELVTDGQSPDVADKAAMQQVFRSLVEEKLIPTELVPKDWSRFADNLYTALQVLEGGRPTGRSFRPLRNSDLAFGIIRQYFQTTNGQEIPRSLSLFQLVLGLLCLSGEFEGFSENYYVLAEDSFKSIFPQAKLPGAKFLAQNEPVGD